MGCGASSAPKVVDSSSLDQPHIEDLNDASATSLPTLDEHVGEAVDPTIIPDYWHNKRASEDWAFDDMFYVPVHQHHSFDHLLSSSYVAKCTQDRPCPTGTHGRTPGGCPCVKPGADPGLPTEFRVRRVIRVEDSTLWGKYHQRREAIRAKRSGSVGKFEPAILTQAASQKHNRCFSPLDSSLNEVYLFHGTRVRYALSIAQNDFNIDMAGSNRGTLLGRGVYLGESITKADEYAKDDNGAFYDGVFCVLLCRVCMGKVYFTSDDQNAADKFRSGEFDSTCGTRLFRELVVYDADQLYPEYIVIYQRVYAKDDKEEINKLLKKRFVMEVPLHWRNNAKALADGFQEKRPCKPHTTSFFQLLVDESLPGGPKQTLTLAQRVENSEVWQRYTAMKAELREHLLQSDASALGADGHDKMGAVEQDIRELTRTPCRYFSKGNCRDGDKCKFVHNLASAQAGELVRAAGQRMPSDELDEQLNERLLWMACSKENCSALTKGKMLSAPEEMRRYHASLASALSRQPSKKGTRFVLLCRVLCGEQSGPQAHCSVESTGSISRPEVVIPRNDQVYPEFILELFCEADAAREEAEAADGEDGGEESPAGEESPWGGGAAVGHEKLSSDFEVVLVSGDAVDLSGIDAVPGDFAVLLKSQLAERLGRDKELLKLLDGSRELGNLDVIPYGTVTLCAGSSKFTVGHTLDEAPSQEHLTITNRYGEAQFTLLQPPLTLDVASASVTFRLGLGFADFLDDEGVDGIYLGITSAEMEESCTFKYHCGDGFKSIAGFKMWFTETEPVVTRNDLITLEYSSTAHSLVIRDGEGQQLGDAPLTRRLPVGGSTAPLHFFVELGEGQGVIIERSSITRWPLTEAVPAPPPLDEVGDLWSPTGSVRVAKLVSMDFSFVEVPRVMVTVDDERSSVRNIGSPKGPDANNFQTTLLFPPLSPEVRWATVSFQLHSGVGAMGTNGVYLGITVADHNIVEGVAACGASSSYVYRCRDGDKRVDGAWHPFHTEAKDHDPSFHNDGDIVTLEYTRESRSLVVKNGDGQILGDQALIDKLPAGKVLYFFVDTCYKGQGATICETPPPSASALRPVKLPPD